MNFSKDLFLLFLSVLLLPLSAIWPYIWYGNGLKVVFWAVDNMYLPFWIILVFSLLALVVVFVLLRSINPWGRLSYTIATLTITINSAYIAMQEHSHSMLVSIFFLAAVQISISEWMRLILRRPYYLSRRNWWEGYPKALPGISGTLLEKTKPDSATRRQEVTFSNMGDEGCFVFSRKKPIDFIPRHIEVRLDNGLTFKSDVSIMLNTRDKFGMGLKFKEHAINQDWQKEMSDYLNHLRRLGYVTY